MKRFQFKLQTVLDYRSSQVDQAQQMVAKELHICTQITERINKLDQTIEQVLLDQQTALAQNQLDISTAQAFPHYVMRLKQQRFIEYTTLQQREEILNQTRELLKQAMIKQKALEKLKEKQQSNFSNALEKHEEAFLAELSLNKIARQRQGHTA